MIEASIAIAKAFFDVKFSKSRRKLAQNFRSLGARNGIEI